MDCLLPTVGAAHPAPAVVPSPLPLDDIAFADVIASMVHRMYPTNVVFNFQPGRDHRRDCVPSSVYCRPPPGLVPRSAAFVGTATAESSLGGLHRAGGDTICAGAPTSVNAAAVGAGVKPSAMCEVNLPCGTAPVGIQLPGGTLDSATTTQRADCSSSSSQVSVVAHQDQTSTFNGRCCLQDATPFFSEIVHTSVASSSSLSSVTSCEDFPYASSSTSDVAPTINKSWDSVVATTSSTWPNSDVNLVDASMPSHCATFSEVSSLTGCDYQDDGDVSPQSEFQPTEAVVSAEVSSTNSLPTGGDVLLSVEMTSAEAVPGQTEATASSSADTETNVCSSVTSSVDSGVFLSEKDYFDRPVVSSSDDSRPVSEIFASRNESKFSLHAKTQSLGSAVPVCKSDSLVCDVSFQKSNSCVAITSSHKDDSSRSESEAADNGTGAPYSVTNSHVSGDSLSETNNDIISKETKGYTSDVKCTTERSLETTGSRHASRADWSLSAGRSETTADIPMTKEDFLISLWNFLLQSPLTQMKRTGRPTSIIRGLPQTREQFDASLRLIETRETTFFPRECQPFEIIEDPPKNFGLLLREESKCLVKVDPLCRKCCTCSDEGNPNNPMLMPEDKDNQITYYVIIGNPGTEEDIRKSMLLINRPCTQVVLSTKQRPFRIARVSKVTSTQTGETSPQRERSPGKDEMGVASSRNRYEVRQEETVGQANLRQTSINVQEAKDEAPENQTVSDNAKPHTSQTHENASAQTDSGACLEESNSHLDKSDLIGKRTTEFTLKTSVHPNNTEMSSDDASACSNRVIDDSEKDLTHFQEVEKHSHEVVDEFGKSQTRPDKIFAKPEDSTVPMEQSTNCDFTHYHERVIRPLDPRTHSDQVISSCNVSRDVGDKQSQWSTKESVSYPQKMCDTKEESKTHLELTTLPTPLQNTSAQACPSEGTHPNFVESFEHSEMHQHVGGLSSVKEIKDNICGTKPHNLLLGDAPPRKSRFNFKVVTVEPEAPKYIYPHANKAKQLPAGKLTTPEDGCQLKSSAPNATSNTADLQTSTEDLRLASGMQARPPRQSSEAAPACTESDLSSSYAEKTESNATSKEAGSILAPSESTSPKAVQRGTSNGTDFSDPLLNSGFKNLGLNLLTSEDAENLPPQSPTTPCTLTTIQEESYIASPEPHKPTEDVNDNIPPSKISRENITRTQASGKGPDDLEKACAQQMDGIDEPTSVKSTLVQPRASNTSRLPVLVKTAAQKPRDGLPSSQLSQARLPTDVSGFENLTSQAQNNTNKVKKTGPAGYVPTGKINKVMIIPAVQDETETSDSTNVDRLTRTEQKQSTTTCVDGMLVPSRQRICNALSNTTVMPLTQTIGTKQFVLPPTINPNCPQDTKELTSNASATTESLQRLKGTCIGSQIGSGFGQKPDAAVSNSVTVSKAESSESIDADRQKPGIFKDNCIAPKTTTKLFQKCVPDSVTKTGTISTPPKPQGPCSLPLTNPKTKSKLTPLKIPKTIHTSALIDSGNAGSAIGPMPQQTCFPSKPASCVVAMESGPQLPKGVPKAAKPESAVQQKSGHLKAMKPVEKPQACAPTDDCSSVKTSLITTRYACGLGSVSASAAVAQESLPLKDSRGKYKISAIIQTKGLPVKSTRTTDKPSTQIEARGTASLAGATKTKSPPLQRARGPQYHKEICGATTTSPTSASKCDKSSRAI